MTKSSNYNQCNSCEDHDWESHCLFKIKTYMSSRTRLNKKISCKSARPFLGRLKCRHQGCHLKLLQHLKAKYRKKFAIMDFLNEYGEGDGIHVTEEGYMYMVSSTRNKTFQYRSPNNRQPSRSSNPCSKSDQAKTQLSAEKKQSRRKNSRKKKYTKKKLTCTNYNVKMPLLTEHVVDLSSSPVSPSDTYTTALTSNEKNDENHKEDNTNEVIGFEICTTCGYRSLDLFSSGEDLKSEYFTSEIIQNERTLNFDSVNVPYFPFE